MLKDAKKILIKAKRKKKAIGAFNVSSIEALQAVVEAASRTKLPVFITTSHGESRYLTPELVAEICSKLSKVYKVDYCLHLDHGSDIDWIKRCLDAGYNSIHCDYADLSFNKNVEKTLLARKITDLYGAQLEGELGVVPLRYYKDKIEDNLEITDPDLASKYVSQTGVDSIAVSIGTQSGKYKKVKSLDIQTLSKINELLPEIPFVLHGGSFLSSRRYKFCIANGVAKINVNAELRLAYTEVLKANIKADSDEYAPYRLLKGTREAMRKIITEKMEVFNKT